MVLTGGNSRFGEEIASALDWWVAAGVDVATSEAPRSWLAPPVPRAPAATPIAAEPKPAMPAPAALPDDLAALHALLAEGAYIAGAAPPRRRVRPSGDPASALMIVTDMPDPADLEARHLFAGETARLFDAMLAAMGRSRDTIYLAPLSPARITGGQSILRPARH